MDRTRRRLNLALMALFGGICAVSPAVAQNTPVTAASDGEPQRLQEGVVGVVTDSSGAPVRDAMIQAVPVGENAAPVPELAIMSNSRGEYAWPLPAGDYELIVYQGSKASAPQKTSVTSGGRTKLDFVLGD